jgi:hypothetical protein
MLGGGAGEKVNEKLSSLVNKHLTVRHVMKLVCKSLVVAAGLFAILGSAAQAESGTVRILHDEPYGAIVTKEAGVLVFRGLPPTRKVIVNPGGKTPLELRQTEVTENKVVVVTQDDYVRQLGARILRIK